MNDELVIKGLIDLYSERGIDLHLLMDDPMFQHLPLKSKVSLIKQYASHISSPTSRVITSGDVKRLLINSAAGAGLAGASVLARRVIANKATGTSLPISIKGLAIATGIGAAAAAAKTGYDQYKNISQKRDINSQIDLVARSGSDIDAIKAIGLRNLQTGPNKATPNLLSAYINDISNSAVPLGIEYGNVRYDLHGSNVAAGRMSHIEDTLGSPEFRSAPEEHQREVLKSLNGLVEDSNRASIKSTESTNRFIHKIQESFKGIL